MKDSLSNSIGWGCANALQISALALTGSCTLLGMSALIPNNHMPQSIEDAARRLADASVVVGTCRVLIWTFTKWNLEEHRLC